MSDGVYFRRLLSPEVPRRGDEAAVVRHHCVPETGRVVKVVNDPHFGDGFCSSCGQKVADYFVEVECAEWGPGPHFVPITWLRRVLPLASRTAVCAS